MWTKANNEREHQQNRALINFHREYGRTNRSARYDIEYATMLNVSGDIETVANADLMGWTGTYIEGYFIRRYDPYTGETTQWIGDMDEGETIGFDTRLQAEKYLESIE